MNFGVEQLLIHGDGGVDLRAAGQRRPHGGNAAEQTACAAVKIGVLGGLARIVAGADVGEIERVGVFAHGNVKALAGRLAGQRLFKRLKRSRTRQAGQVDAAG